MSFTLAIVGRPNVGKSTLFNRLVGKKIALVDDLPGVTRDRRIHDAKLYDLTFQVIDTAGLEEVASQSLEGRMRAQTELAIDEADLVLFVVDAKAGINPADVTFADLVRRSGKKVILVANKAEARGAESGMYDSYQLGLGEPCPISAEHGQGFPDLRDAIVEALGEETVFPDEHAPQQEGDAANVTIPAVPRPHDELIGDDIDDPDAEDIPSYDPSKPLRIAIVGRPNAGKSTLINSMLGEERLLTGPEAGITRDSISADWEWNGRKIRLFDTAGLRRKARVQEKLEKLSVGDALRAIRFAEVVIIVLDATIPFEKQDLQIADLIIREGRAPVIAFNKWDLVENRQMVLADLREKTDRLLPQVRGIRAVPISGERNQGIDKLMAAVAATDEMWNRRISTGRLNRWLEGVIAHHPPPAVAGRRLKIKYITQVKTRPPGFVISCSRPEAFPTSYVRYLTNGLRETFDILGVPIRVVLRTSDNPFANRARKKR
ncbi:ribosome biogenesis GTPase Der [Phyllobacterium sp. 21LDTY02-6]|jgi:GTPase|uniref:ribosome biogenesis GTPase Der n=1 Tax=unclassified Phyllobacterium TaxID=2638441 RepID=UPI002020D3EE|nr:MULTISPECIES: ribosome biogenesis GTPase Der [unclassified Phyllobacterium]MCO4318531.1 ribosome biogenesis GTPase Der [Phyllobacterium sp. 21LDTY02-6]MCX8281045.1 ribosome biogenesis GTPase Der [Phyllobacterium sp. 0TCS1.6C]MCX8294668.1 ribosome biogenesis GTPase Der [Phyllobacterium sp. 0TCS1.6A]